MSPEVVAALVGVVVGVLAERIARSWGRLWCEPTSWRLRYMSRDEAGYDRELPPGEEDRAEKVEYSLGLDLFNGKEIPVGLRDISVVFVGDGGELVSKPWSAPSGRLEGGRTNYATLILINLAPRQWDHVELLGVLDVETAKSLRRVDFVGQRQRRGLFKGKTFRKNIGLPFPAPRG